MDERYFIVSDNPNPVGLAQVFDQQNTTHSGVYTHNDCAALADWLNDRDGGYILTMLRLRDILTP
jgi:hypothetical protein